MRYYYIIRMSPITRIDADMQLLEDNIKTSVDRETHS